MRNNGRYLDMLPTTFGNPLWFTDDELAELKGTTLHQATKLQVNSSTLPPSCRVNLMHLTFQIQPFWICHYFLSWNLFLSVLSDAFSKCCKCQFVLNLHNFIFIIYSVSILKKRKNSPVYFTFPSIFMNFLP